MKRVIKKVAVLGSGVMGSRIACHFANIGLDVLLLDIVPQTLLPDEEKKGLTLSSTQVRNRIVSTALDAVIKSNPSPLYKSDFRKRIELGNLEDDLSRIAGCDWVLEAVIENLSIKKQLFEKVDAVRKPGTLITSNTSGIPITLMAEGRSDDFVQHFCGTHFFNPPRYLKLLEIIPTPKTKAEVLDFLTHYGDVYLGKTVVICKDTPAFIANRVGIFSIMDTVRVSKQLGLKVEDVDKLTGPVIGRPKSATFRTGDVVGLDTLIKVAENLYTALPEDEARSVFQLPDFLKTMIEKGWLGDKSGQGFYKKTKDETGKTEIHSLDLDDLTYKTQVKTKFQTLEDTKTIDDLRKRYAVLVQGNDVAAQFYQKSFGGLFSYVSHRIPEISDDIYKIDDALKAGFGWEHGPFEIWDALGLDKGIDLIVQSGNSTPEWVLEMRNAGKLSFYASENNMRMVYDVADKVYKRIPGTEAFIILDNFRKTNLVWGNAGASLIDIGDGIVNLEFHSKMNTLGSEVVQAINTSIEKAEKDFNGLVIANEGANFSVGANLAMLLMYALEQEWDEIHQMVAVFQRTMMRARYSSVPVVIAPHNMALGGGCELTLHGDKVVAHAELYIGLVEFGVGLIPAGGGTKEFTLRASDAYQKGDIEYNTLQNYYINIAMGKVATSAYEAADMHIIRPQDSIVINRNRQIAAAKKEAINLANKGYTKPTERKDIKVQGRGGLAMFYTGASSMHRGGYISEHDVKISQKLAHIMCGGDLSYPQYVSEQYLLDLEREAFVSLCGERKTLERIQYMLNTGKPLRN